MSMLTNRNSIFKSLCVGSFRALLPVARLFSGLWVQLPLIVVILLLAACAPEPQADIRIATNQWLGYEPLYIARDKHFLPKDTFKFLELPNATAVLNAFRNGAINVAALTLDEAILLQHEGVDLHILLVMDISAGADALLARPDITSLPELKGKRIGVESGDVGVFMLSRILDRTGLQLTDVTILPMTMNDHTEAFVSGRVDAVVTFEPVRTVLLHKGAKVLFDSRQMPNEIFDVLVVDSALYKTHLKELQQLTKAWFRSLDFIQNTSNEAVILMSARMKLSPSDIMTATQGIDWGTRTLNQEILLGENPVLLSATERIMHVMLEHHLIDKPINPKVFLDPFHQEILQ